MKSETTMSVNPIAVTSGINCESVRKLNPQISGVGVDISPLMKEEAEKR
jgi:hypothetical protein